MRKLRRPKVDVTYILSQSAEMPEHSLGTGNSYLEREITMSLERKKETIEI